MTHEIKCAGGCGKVLATVEIEEGQEYQSDQVYAMYCDECPKPNAEETAA